MSETFDFDNFTVIGEGADQTEIVTQADLDKAIDELNFLRKNKQDIAYASEHLNIMFDRFLAQQNTAAELPEAA